VNKHKVKKDKGQSIKEYAYISNIPLNYLIEDLKNDGFICNPSDNVTPNIRKTLSTLFKKRYRVINHLSISEQSKTLAIESKKKKKENEIKESEVLKNAEEKAGFSLSELIKIGRVIDICFDLLPVKLRKLITKRINNESVSNYYIELEYQYLLSKYSYKNINFKTVTFPPSISNNYNLDTLFTSIKDKSKSYSNTDIYDQFVKLIVRRKKDKLYTYALLEIIYFILNARLVYENKVIWKYKELSFIGELLIDMGAIDASLKLYKVDENIFSNSNHLSILTSGAVKTGDLISAEQLIPKLIEQEPYHPSIPILQTEIKRLEQRNYLKSKASIDFSKINELTGIEFENLLIDKFLSLGFIVESTPKTGDFGADLIVENSEGSRVIIQCKRFKSKVNLKAVQEVVGAMGHYAGDIGIVITNNLFLNSAIKLAESHDVELWNGDSLVSFLAGDLSFSSLIGDP